MKIYIYFRRKCWYSLSHKFDMVVTFVVIKKWCFNKSCVPLKSSIAYCLSSVPFWRQRWQGKMPFICGPGPWNWAGSRQLLVGVWVWWWPPGSEARAVLAPWQWPSLWPVSLHWERTTKSELRASPEPLILMTRLVQDFTVYSNQTPAWTETSIHLGL